MDQACDYRNTVIVLVVVIAASLFIIYKQYDLMQTVSGELNNERDLSLSLSSENALLAEANDILRERVIDLHTNLSHATWVMEQLTSVPIPQPPTKRVTLSDLVFREETVMLNVMDIIPGIIAPSDSMSPLLTGDTIVLEIEPERYLDIFPGDIIIYEHEGTRIIHRVLRIGWDNDGWFAIAKGDNNPRPDPHKVRFEQIRGVVVGIIY